MTGGTDIEATIRLLGRLPGMGPRSARRIALHLLKRRETVLEPLRAALTRMSESVCLCPVCGNYDVQQPCAVCRDERRDGSVLCVVEDVDDLWALERTDAFAGRYHVLGGALSALDGVGPDDLGVERLVERVRQGKGVVTEVFLALPTTVEGQTTAYYIADALAGCDVAISGLARGIPMGGELDYLDEGTLSQAIRGRGPL